MSLIALAMLSNPAHALSCAWGVHSSNVHDASVPSNVSIVLEHTFENLDSYEVQLEDASSNAIDASLEQYVHSATVVPASPLEMGTYTLTVINTTDDTTAYQTEFTVDSEADSEAPEATTFIQAEREDSKSEWGESQGIAVEVETVEGAAAYEFQLAESDDFSDGVRILRPWPSMFIGRGLCDSNMPDYDTKTDYHLRVRTIDLAGNTSEWTEFVGPIPSAGCSSTNAPASLLLGGLASLALFGRRRRS